MMRGYAPGLADKLHEINAPPAAAETAKSSRCLANSEDMIARSLKQADSN
jgi:hypothetical protein